MVGCAVLFIAGAGKEGGIKYFQAAKVTRCKKGGFDMDKITIYEDSAAYLSAIPSCFQFPQADKTRTEKREKKAVSHFTRAYRLNHVETESNSMQADFILSAMPKDIRETIKKDIVK
jgi:hypothetical protein